MQHQPSILEIMYEWPVLVAAEFLTPFLPLSYLLPRKLHCRYYRIENGSAITLELVNLLRTHYLKLPLSLPLRTA